MANTLLTPQLITKEALMVLENNLAFSKAVDKGYSENFGTEVAAGQKIGSTLKVRMPVRYVGRTGPTLVPEDATETSVDVTLDTQAGVDLSFSSKELTLSIDEFSDRFIKPAMANISNRIDYDGLQQFRKIYNSVSLPGTPGVGGQALKPYSDANVRLDNTATPRDGNRNAVITPQNQADLIVGLSGLFNDTTDIGKQYRDGIMGRTIGTKFSMDQNCGALSIGPQGGTPLVNGATVSGATSISTRGWTAAIGTRLLPGDIFTIAGVFTVNPQSHQMVAGVLQQFVVTAPFASAADGTGIVSISPAIITTGGFKTVNAVPIDGAAITVNGVAGTVTPQSMVFHRDAFTLACADLEMPRGVDFSARKADRRTGVSVRLVRAYDISSDNFPCRLDVLYGWATLRPEMACRVQG